MVAGISNFRKESAVLLMRAESSRSSYCCPDHKDPHSAEWGLVLAKPDAQESGLGRKGGRKGKGRVSREQGLESHRATREVSGVALLK